MILLQCRHASWATVVLIGYKQQGVPCQLLPTFNTTLQVVHSYWSPKSSTVPGPSVLESEQFNGLFFFAIGVSPVISTALSAQPLVPLLHSN
jgi:hypothetical protein